MNEKSFTHEEQDQLDYIVILGIRHEIQDYEMKISNCVKWIVSNGNEPIESIERRKNKIRYYKGKIEYLENLRDKYINIML